MYLESSGYGLRKALLSQSTVELGSLGVAIGALVECFQISRN